MGEDVTGLRIIDAGQNIFDTDIEYIIPLYQRAFAWEDKQLTQLVEDINSVPDDAYYYIGTLIVSRQGDKFEVVDGQQRLISLYLLLNCLGQEVKNTLTFACREKSNYTLENIKELLQDNQSKFDMERIEPTIHRGLNILTEELQKTEYNKADFLKKLERVVIFRIEVPDNTDLNRYFEIMNTRGEQLEQHDILKAKLMSYLRNDLDKAVFAKIWDACSDMTGYVQMHFISKDNDVREKLFGSGWNSMPPDKWDTYSDVKASSLEGLKHKISDIINEDTEIDSDDGYTDDDVRVRFESIIEFPYFLIHTLNVLINNKINKDEDGEVPLDDKRLVDSFEGIIESGVTDAESISDNKEQFSKDFIMCLLRTRYLFDKFIIKREYANENSDGEWSLKRLCVSVQKQKKKPYYQNTDFVSSDDVDKNDQTKTNLMLQSALRVSYTSPKAMHWITQLLSWLYRHTKHLPDNMAGFSEAIEDIAKKAVRKNFFDVCKDGSYEMGVNTPHIVFNYLDYLLWNANRKEYNGFVFEFRNSVEHWYPRNPAEGKWTDGVDRFGNLCIVQRNVNSMFSNMSPEAKKSTFRDRIDKGSLKLRKMRDLTEGKDGKNANLCWKETMCKQHEDEMIRILRSACGLEEESDN